MKTILKANATFIISIFFLFIAVVSINAQDSGNWEILNEGESYRDIDFIDENIGWISGKGIILKTEDGGDTWSSLFMDNNWIIEDIDFVNESIGWARGLYRDEIEGGYHSIVAKSVDGGQTWTTQLKRGGKINAINDSVVYVTGGSSILKTSDGGVTWTDQKPNSTNFYIHSVWSFDINNLLVVCHTENPEYEGIMILNTLDGGDTWEEKRVPEFDGIGDIQFINDSTGYFIAYIHEEEGTSQSLYKSIDTLNTWTLFYYPDSLNVEFFHAFNDTAIWAIIDSHNGFIDLSRNINKSTDGGITWEKKQTMWWGIFNVFFTKSGVGFMTEYPERSDGMNLYKSIDQGDTWKMKKMGHFLTDIYFINESLGFAGSGYIDYGWGHVESFGNLLITNDGGKSWRHSYSFPNDYIFSCMFINDKVGFVLSRNPLWRGYIYKTVDSGYNWSPVYEENFDLTGYDFIGNDIGFKSEEVGWAVGSGNWADESSGGIIMETTDGGENWDLVWKYPDFYESKYGLNSIHVVNTTAWAVGESGLIVRYIDQDQWNPKTGETDLPLNDVFFSDENHGWIAGGYLNEQDFQSILLITDNGGATWQEKRFQEYLINDIYFENNLHGWAVGNDTSIIGFRNAIGRFYHGIILETWDSGNNWNMIVDGLSEPLNAIHFKDGFGWAVGGNGLVLRYDGVNWIDQNTDKTYPNKFSLSQNYPNPFNPTTAIGYQLPAVSNVEISVYNLLGQKIATLVKQKQRAGYHQVEWEASGFSSGIYYYRIEVEDPARRTGEFQDVKKMILIK